MIVFASTPRFNKFGYPVLVWSNYPRCPLGSCISYFRLYYPLLFFSFEGFSTLPGGRGPVQLHHAEELPRAHRLLQRAAEEEEGGAGRQHQPARERPADPPKDKQRRPGTATERAATIAMPLGHLPPMHMYVHTTMALECRSNIITVMLGSGDRLLLSPQASVPFVYVGYPLSHRCTQDNRGGQGQPA